MTFTVIAAVVFIVLALLVAVFHLAMVLGAPLGHLTMGGRWPGALPARIRIASGIQSVLMLGLAWVIAGAAGLVTPIGAGWLVWVVVAITGLATLANNITPSRAERALWGPVTVIMFLAAMSVAV